MPEYGDLFLHELIFLLALKDEEGTVNSGAIYNFAVGGALMSELLLREKLHLNDEKKPRVVMDDRTPLGDPLLDE